MTGRVALTCITVVFALLLVRQARAGQVFQLAQLESRFVRVGKYVDERLPQNALVITGLESGSVRYYSGRRTIVWDALDTDWLDGVIRFSRERGLEPYVVLESWEEPLFRMRFPNSAIARLDWPPIAEVASRVRVFRPADRERYLKGIGYTTEYVR